MELFEDLKCTLDEKESEIESEQACRTFEIKELDYLESSCLDASKIVKKNPLRKKKRHGGQMVLKKKIFKTHF